jgi:hypothetical protein
MIFDFQLRRPAVTYIERVKKAAWKILFDYLMTTTAKGYYESKQRANLMFINS